LSNALEKIICATTLESKKNKIKVRRLEDPHVTPVAFRLEYLSLVKIKTI
jgi:hypothetical protein